METWHVHVAALSEIAPQIHIADWQWQAPQTATSSFPEVSFAVIADGSIDAPDLPTETPIPTILAQVARAAQPPQAMAFLRDPDSWFAEGDPGHAIGLRGLFLDGAAAAEQAWERLLASGLPLWGLSEVVAGSGDPFWSLMYGNFITATAPAVLPSGWEEDRLGIRWQDGPTYEVLDRNGFVLATGTGAGAWTDRGDEGLVRVRWRNVDGQQAWSQPRLIAPNAQGAGVPTPGGGCG